ncbi:MAG: hypothetical protein AB7U81_08145 [Thiohalomonadaceae bacterium]
MTHEANPWWGEFSLAAGEPGRWRIGPLVLWIECAHKEWRLAWQREGACGEGSAGDAGERFLPDAAATQRFAFRQPGSTVSLQPALADRPVVFRPAQPLSIPPGETCTLYLESPLWLVVQAGEPRQSLADVPLSLPSDTWFGPPVRPGGLAYALTTPAAMELTAVADGHAVTPLSIRNGTDADLPVQRIHLPVPLLALYRAGDGRLWTEAVVLERSGSADDLASLRLGRGAPEEAGNCTLLAPARQSGDRNLVIQAFSRLFS